MKTERPWSQEDIEKLRKLRERGWGRRKMAKALGRSLGSVRHGLQRYAVDCAPEEPGEPAEQVVWEDWEVPAKVNWREFFSSWNWAQRLARATDPHQEKLTVRLPATTVAIVSASDLHLGGGYTSHEAIRQTIELILREDGLYLGLTGDTIEGFLPGLKGAEASEQMVGPVKAQLKALEDLTDELTSHGKLLWMTWGDHDAKWFEQTVGVNIVKLLVERKVPYFVGRGLVELLIGEQRYWLLLNHAERFASQWSDTHAQRRAYERFFPADVVIAGHRHRPSFRMEHHYEMLREAGLDVGGKTWLVANGTFKTGPDVYTIRQWSRGILGVPTIVFRADQHDCDVLESPKKALAFMRGLKPDEPTSS